jgi:hypothetical protein
MRRLCLILLCGLVAVPAALAASGATGDGVLELRAVAGIVVIGSVAQPARGALYGQMDRGTLRVTDPVAGDGSILVSGYEHKIPETNPLNGLTVMTYTGKDLHFRVTGGKYKLWFNGSGIDLTAVGVGTASFRADPDVEDTGDYALDGGRWTSVVNQKNVPFGTQAPPPTATP